MVNSPAQIPCTVGRLWVGVEGRAGLEAILPHVFGGQWAMSVIRLSEPLRFFGISGFNRRDAPVASFLFFLVPRACFLHTVITVTKCYLMLFPRDLIGSLRVDAFCHVLGPSPLDGSFA